MTFSLAVLVAVVPLVAMASCAAPAVATEDALDAGGPKDSPLPSATPCPPGAFCPVELPAGSDVSLNGIWGSGPDDVWIVGSPSMTIHWDGKSFRRARLPQRESLRGVWGSGKGDVWTFGTSQTLWRSQGFSSEDGGWSRSSGKTGVFDNVYSMPIYAMWGANANDLWAVGASIRALDETVFYPSVLHSDGWRNGEPDWHSSPTGRAMETTVQQDGTIIERGAPVHELVTFNAICGSQATGIWSVGEGGKTRYTSGWANGAATWTRINSHTDRGLYALWCSPDGDVWAGGEAATMHRFSRGAGGDYVEATVDMPVTTSVRAFWGAAADDLWAVGDGRTVLHWDGNVWEVVETRESSDDREDLFAVWGSSKDDIWFAGRNILMRRSSNARPEKVQ